MITLEQAHEQQHTVFSIFAKPGEDQTLNDWIRSNTYLRKSVVAEHVAECITNTKVAPTAIVATVYHCYRADEQADLAGMFMIELKRVDKNHLVPQTEVLCHVVLRTMIVNGTEHIVFGTDYDIKTIDMSEFSKGSSASVDDLRMWMSVYRGDGTQGEVLFGQLRDFLNLHNLTPQQVEFVRGNALRHPREGREGLIKLYMRPKGAKDMVLATLRFETSFLTFDQRQILEADGFIIEATRLLYEMNTPPTPVDTAAQTEQPAQEADMALEENNAAASDTKAAEATPQQPQQEATTQPEQKKEEPAPVLVPLENGGPVSLQCTLEWLEGHSVERPVQAYFKELLEKVCKTHDVEPELVQFAFAPVKHASLLGTKQRNNDELSSELGLVDMAVLVPVVGKPLGAMQLGSMLTFTTTAEWETQYRIGSKPQQVEKILYLTDPTLRQNQHLAVNRVDSLSFGASALMVLTNTASAREVKDIERLWGDIQRRYSYHRDLDRRLASQVVIKFERVISPSLRSNHTLERGLIKGKVYSPGADSKLLFGFDVYTELESIDQGKLSECIGAFEVEMPKMGPPPVFEPLSARTKAMGGKSVDVGSAANPIPDTEAPKTDPTTLFQGHSHTASDPKEGLRMRPAARKDVTTGEAPAVNMMQGGVSLRFMTLLDDVVGYEEFTSWLAFNVPVSITSVYPGVTAHHFFEIVKQQRPVMDATTKEASHVIPGTYHVRVFDPDRNDSEVTLVVMTAVMETSSPLTWQEYVIQVGVLGSPETKKAPPPPPVTVSTAYLPGTCFATPVWVFFNHAMAGIIELIDDEERQERVRNMVKYIDQMYHHKGVNDEIYDVHYVEHDRLQIRVKEAGSAAAVVELVLNLK